MPLNPGDQGIPHIKNKSFARRGNHTGTVESENARRVTVEPYGICSGWDGERMNLGYVMDVVTETYARGRVRRPNGEVHAPRGPAPGAPASRGSP